MVPGARGRGTSGLIHDSACSHCRSVFERLLKPGAGCVVGMRESQERAGKKAAPKLQKHQRIVSKTQHLVLSPHVMGNAGHSPMFSAVGVKGGLALSSKEKQSKLRAPQLRHLVARYVSTAAKQASPTPRLLQDADCAPGLQGGVPGSS